MSKIILTNIEPGLNATSEEMANVLIQRMGLMPRKKGSTEKMHKVLIHLYERAKLATREKDPKMAIMTVEDMGVSAGITRQTMYEYLRRWLELDMITKTSYIDQWNKVIIGYKLNGATIEAAFERAKRKVIAHLDDTQKYVIEMQKLLKNEKISETVTRKTLEKNEAREENKEEERLKNGEKEDIGEEKTEKEEVEKSEEKEDIDTEDVEKEENIKQVCE